MMSTSELERSSVSVVTENDIVTARQTGRSMAASLGFNETDQTLIATAISEVARNLISYGGGGDVHFEIVERGGDKGLNVKAVDQGPGIVDIDKAMQDGFSTVKSLGLGLPGARRLMDDFEISSEPGRGTSVTMVKWAGSSGKLTW